MSAAAPARLGRWAARLEVLASPRVRVSAFPVVLIAGGLLGLMLLTPYLVAPDAPLTIPWPLFALLCFLAEVKVIYVHFRRGTLRSP